MPMFIMAGMFYIPFFRLSRLKILGNEERTLLAQKISNISSHQEIVESITNLANAKFDQQTTSQSLLSKCRNWAYKGLGYLNGATTTTSFSLLNFYVGSEASKLLLDDPFFYYSAGGVIVLCNTIREK